MFFFVSHFCFSFLFLQISPKQGLIYLVSRGGYILVFDAQSGSLILRHQVSREAVFVSCGDTKRGGVLFANRKGFLLL